MKTYIPGVIYLFILVFISVSCQKEEKKTGPETAVEVSDLIYYPDRHIAVEFKVVAQGGTPPYSITWTNPDSLDGFGPYQLRILSDLTLDFRVTDAANLSESNTWQLLTDTIDSLKYDYRNKYAGRYRCNVASYYNGATEYFTDTLTVSKTSSFNTVTVQTLFDVAHNNPGNVITYLNSGGWFTYPDGDFYGYHSGARFRADSIWYTQSGPLGYYYTNTYVGVRF